MCHILSKQQLEKIWSMSVIGVLTIFFLTQNVKLAATIFFVLAIVFSGYVAILKIWEVNLAKSADMQHIDQMNDLEFELYIQQIFQCKGYSISSFTHSLHYGIDFILADAEGKRIIVKTKRTDYPVTILPIQLLTIAKSLYQADHAWIITSHTYHDSSLRIGKSNGIELFQRSDVMKWSKAYKKKVDSLVLCENCHNK